MVGAGSKPGRWWYVVAGVVAGGTVVGTGVLGVGRAVDLVDEVDAFQRFDGPGSMSVSIVEPGDYAVYHEDLVRAAGQPTDGFVITVTAPDGSDVPVRPSSTSYGWGRKQAEGVGSFEAEQPGNYRIEATGDYGQLAFGRHIPGEPLYGLGPTMLVALAIVAGCAAGSLVVARRRRAGAGSPPTPPVVVAVVAVGALVVVGVAVAVAVAQRVDSGSPEVALSEGTDETTRSTIECLSDADFETGMCGTSPEELREANLAYADRLDFTGDLDAANLVVERARTALAPIAGVLPQPSVEEVQAALAPVSPDVAVIDNAVRTAGTAFGIGVDGGCVFGSVHDGAVEVEVGGYVNDGGCLAAYGH